MILIALVILAISGIAWGIYSAHASDDSGLGCSIIFLSPIFLLIALALLGVGYSDIEIAFKQPLIRYKAYSVDNGTQINGKITKGFIYMSGFVNEKFVYRVLVSGADDTYKIITIGADSTRLVFDDNKTPGVYVGGKKVQALNKFGKIVFYPFKPKEYTRHYIDQYLILPKNAKPIGFELM